MLLAQFEGVDLCRRIAWLAKVNVDPSVDKGTSFMDAGSVYFKDLPTL